MARKHSDADGENQPAQKRARVERSETPVDDQNSGSEYDSDPQEDAFVQKAAMELASQAKKVGSIREAGAISKVVLVQFMCHSYQVVELGPQINFVIGHNGSGKSAVLTAITLVLGAKANSTNRGSNMKSFIKEGQSKAEVTLHLTNRGDEAYQPEVFGDEIIIERSIVKEGGGGYKIRNRDKKVISTKKEALQAILDHFMIQADNPLNVLNQDAAKKFLNASTSKQKYELFIRGTQLQQLTDEYEAISANITMSRTILEKKRVDLPELLLLAKKAERTLTEVKNAAQAQDKMAELTNELVWLHVKQGEESRDEAALEVQKEEHALPKYEKRISTAEEQLTQLKAEIAEIEAEKSSHNDANLEARHSELVREIKQQNETLKALNHEIREAGTHVKQFEREIATHQRAIDDENQKSMRNTDASRQHSIEQVQQLTAEIERIERRLIDVKQAIDETNKNGKLTADSRKTCSNESSGLRTQIDELRRKIQEAEKVSQGRIHAFGAHNVRLKQAIDQQRWQEKPIGPLGMYVQLRDRQWTAVVETVLGNSLNTYLVTNASDEGLFRDLMKRTNCRAVLTRTARDLFDYTHGEPAPELTTILRVLNFEDEFVKRALINEARIEKAILVPSRKDAELILSGSQQGRHNVGSCYTQDGYKIGGGPGGARSMNPLTMYKGPSRLTADDGSFLRDLQQQLTEAEKRWQTLRDEDSKLGQACEKYHNDLQRLKAEASQLTSKGQEAQERKSRIQDELNVNASSNVFALEELKREAEDARERARNVLQELMRQKDLRQAGIAPLKEEKEIIESKFESRQQEDEVLNQRLTELVTQRVARQGELEHFKSSLAKQKRLIDQLKRSVEEKEAALVEMAAQARAVCEERIESDRSVQKVISELQSYTKLVKATEQRHQKSLEEIETSCLEAQANYENAKNQIAEQAGSLRVFRAALALRRERWIQFRIHISVRAKMKFVTHLSKRGFSGKLNFNHNTQRLDIQVNVNEQDASQRGKMSDAKGLSGGEKSFSTISLLLTLWDAINCPIRCLDEFDVFMDEVNRRVAVNMMIESAKEANDVQYIFITPNGLGAATNVGSETKIVRMRDPERDHGVLGSGRT